MGEKSDLFHCDEKMLTYDAAVVLEKITTELKQGKLAASGENGPVCVELPRLCELEISFKEKSKPGKSKKKLSIELTWKDSDAPSGLDG
jgi:amphi-Trp domain-containing protein